MSKDKGGYGKRFLMTLAIPKPKLVVAYCSRATITIAHERVTNVVEEPLHYPIAASRQSERK